MSKNSVELTKKFLEEKLEEVRQFAFDLGEGIFVTVSKKAEKSNDLYEAEYTVTIVDVKM